MERSRLERNHQSAQSRTDKKKGQPWSFIVCKSVSWTGGLAEGVWFTSSNTFVDSLQFLLLIFTHLRFIFTLLGMDEFKDCSFDQRFTTKSMSFKKGWRWDYSRSLMLVYHYVFGINSLLHLVMSKFQLFSWVKVEEFPLYLAELLRT